MQPDRRKKRQHTEHETEHPMAHDESNWLVSYADMMTLLFGFFVLMYSFSKIDTEKFEVVRKDMARAFGGKIIDEKPGNPEGPNILEKRIQEDLGKVLGQNGEFNTEIQNGSLILTMGSDLLFASGSAVAGEKAIQTVQKIYEAMKVQPVELIEIEGHTDANPISTLQFPSNWELSTARASSLVRIFSDLKFDADKLKASGFAATRPVPRILAPNEPEPDWNRRDRRVIINLKIAPQQAGAKQKLIDQGLQIQDPLEQTVKKDSAEKDPSQMTAQEKFEAAQKKLQEASEKWAQAQAQEKKAKELEALNRKTAELEKKLSDLQKKTTESLQKSRVPSNQQPPEM